MISFRTQMFSNFLMFSLLFFSFSVLKVFCQKFSNPITNLQLLDTYLSGASNFIQNRPVFDGITLVLPKSPVHISHRHPHSHNRPNLALPITHPPPHPFHPMLLSPESKPDFEPVFHSIIVPKKLEKHRKYKKSKKNSYYPKHFHSKNYRNRRRNRQKYPKSINDRIREKDYEYKESEELNEEKENEENESESDDPLDEPNEEKFEKPKSYYKSMHPFSKNSQPLKPVFEVKSRLAINRTEGFEFTTKRPKSYDKINDNSEPKYTERLRKPKPQNERTYNHMNSGSKSLFESSPPFTTPDRLNFLKPMIQKNKKESLSSDSPQLLSSDDNKDSYEPKKQRTATANQLSLRNKEKKTYKNIIKNDKEEDEPEVRVIQGLPKEDLESNDDPNYYPHQYAIEIRWKNKNNVHYDLDAPEGDVGDRELHTSKELDHSRHRKYKHEEEEHWHEKKWLKEGLRKAYLNGKPLKLGIVKPTLNLPDPDFSPLPIYAQPLPNGATLDQINQHFAIPTPNFRVNTRFMEWAKNAIPLNPLNNINSYLTVYG